MKKVILGLVLVLSLLIISGCINYSEETWLRENGSGKMKMEFAINEAIIDSETSSNEPSSMEQIKKSFSDKKDIKLISAKTFNKDGNQVMQMEIEYKSLKALEALNNSEGNTSFIGKITIRKNKKGQLIFTRVLSLNSPGSKNSEQNNEFSQMGEQMMNSMFSNYVWKYTVHFPYKVISANTADDYIDRKTNTIKWDVSLLSVSKKPQKMTAVLKPYNFFEGILRKLNLMK